MYCQATIGYPPLHPSFWVVSHETRSWGGEGHVGAKLGLDGKAVRKSLSGTEGPAAAALFLVADGVAKRKQSRHDAKASKGA